VHRLGLRTVAYSAGPQGISGNETYKRDANSLNSPPAEAVRRRADRTRISGCGENARYQGKQGGGPPYRKFGRVVLYRWGDVLAWAEAQLSPPVHSSSELVAVPGRSGR
jgi:hypothetical protein